MKLPTFRWMPTKLDEIYVLIIHMWLRHYTAMGDVSLALECDTIQPIMGNLTTRWPVWIEYIVVLEGQQGFTLLTPLPRDPRMSFILGMGAFTSYCDVLLFPQDTPSVAMGQAPSKYLYLFRKKRTWNNIYTKPI